MSAAERRAPVRLRHRIVYVAGRAALLAVNLLPEKPAYWAMGAVGRLYFRFAKRRRGYALRMLRNAYGNTRSDAELLRIASTATANVFKVVLDTIRVIPWLRSGRLHERLDFADLHRLPQPPFIGLTAHLGSWEMAAISGALLRGEAHGIARVFKNPLLNAFILENRRGAGLVIHQRRGGVRALARALEQGHVGLQVVDQHQRLRGVRVPFFGAPASTERSAVVLALRKGYPLVVGAVVRVGSGFRFCGVLADPLPVQPTGDFAADVRRIATEMNRRLEQLVLAHPDQYLWIHNRYRDRPEKADTHDDPAAR